MKNKSSIILAVLFLTSVMLALGQDIDKQKVRIKYIRLPLIKLDSKIKTYSISCKPIIKTEYGNLLGYIEGLVDRKNNYLGASINYPLQKFMLNGYEMVSETSQADIKIEIAVLSPLAFTKVVQAAVEERTEEVNKVERKFNIYHYKLHYTTPKIKCVITKFNGSLLKEIEIGGVEEIDTYGESLSGGGIQFRSADDLKKSWDNESWKWLSSIEGRFFNKDFKKVIDFIQDFSMQYLETDDYPVYYVSERKTNQYKELLEARDLYFQAVTMFANNRIELINKLADSDSSVRNDLLRKAIALWEKDLKEANYENKKARIDTKVAQCITYNLVMAYNWLNDFEDRKSVV